MLNITKGEFDPDIWNQMVIKAADSSIAGNHKYICRVIHPDETCTLELKTDQEVKDHFKTYGRWNANCGRMSLSEVINLTRINFLNHPETALKEPINKSLILMATRAENKYNSGLIGVVRKIASIFFNFFATDAVSLFGMSRTNVRLRIIEISNQKKLPLFIGNDANFARLVAQGL